MMIKFSLQEAISHCILILYAFVFMTSAEKSQVEALQNYSTSSHVSKYLWFNLTSTDEHGFDLNLNDRIAPVEKSLLHQIFVILLALLIILIWVGIQVSIIVTRLVSNLLFAFSRYLSSHS